MFDVSPKTYQMFQFNLSKQLTTLLLLMVSIFMYSVRPREGWQALLFIENSLFIAAILIFPWSINIKRCAIVGLIALWIYGFATLLVYYPSQADLLIMLDKVSIFSKCILIAILLPQFEVKKLYSHIYFLTICVVLSQILYLATKGVDRNLGFSGVIFDRNYFSALLLCLLASVICLRSVSIEDKRLDLIYLCMQSSVLVLIIFSGSRSGLLALLWLLLITNRRLFILVLLSCIPILYYLGVTDLMIDRVIGSSIYADDRIRLVQYLAFINAFKHEPFALITGFGPMASSHLAWFSSAFDGEDLSKYLYIIHNSSLDLILSFGLAGVWILCKLFRKIPWKPLIFLLLISSFNNMLSFLPFYVLLGAIFSAKRYQRDLSDQY